MSGSYDLPEIADTVSYGILSSRLRTILGRDPGAAIPDDDRGIVEAGARLVADILNGARSLSGTENVTAATAEGIRSLGLALSPLERLARISQHADPSDEGAIAALSEIANLLWASTQTSSLPTDISKLALAQTFFAFLAESLLSTLDQTQYVRSAD